MSRVFVIQETDRNISPAKRFGKLHVLLSTRDVLQGHEHCLEKLKDRLRKEQFSSNDYLLCIGDPIVIGLTIFEASKHAKYIQCLKWDKVENDYESITIELWN